MKNGSQIWPSSGWCLVTNTSGSWVRTQTAVASGDVISIVVNRNSTVSNDTLYFNPAIAFDSKEYKASAGWSTTQGSKNWSYQKYDGTTFTNLTWDGVNGYWRDGATYCIVAYNWQHPDANMSARVFTCPTAGNIVVRGYVNRPSTVGNGVNVKIMKNGVQIWPSSGWKLVNHTANVEALVETSVAANDKIQFVVDKNNDNSSDTTNWDPTISYK